MGQNHPIDRKYEAVVIGTSAGGVAALEKLFSYLPEMFELPVLIVLHLHPDSGAGQLAGQFNRQFRLQIKEADDKEPIQPGTFYFAPANYHLLVEDDRTLSLSVDDKENFSRPSIDVLFESAAEVYQETLIGIILTGASHDGAAGLKKIMDTGGRIIIQDPETAEKDIMPRAAMAACQPEELLSLEDIGTLLGKLGCPG